jgi:hypothetical protein
VTFLEGRSAPLDVYLTSAAPPQSEVCFPAGALLVFLHRRPDRARRPAARRLPRCAAAELDRPRDRPPQALADELTAAMLGGVEAKDDVCVVPARWTGPR